MKKIDFYEKKKALHLEMLEAIVALFEKAGIDEIDLRPEGEWQYNAYVLYCPDGAYSIQEFRVRKVRNFELWNRTSQPVAVFFREPVRLRNFRVLPN